MATTERPSLFIDTETDPFAVGDMAPRIVCVAVSNGTTELYRRDQAEAVLRPALRRAAAGELVIAAHSASYDWACAMRTWPGLADLIWAAYAADGITCTRLRERLLDIGEDKLRGSYGGDGQWVERSYDLADIVRRHFDVQLDKSAESWRTRFAELDAMPIADWPQPAIDYAKDDGTEGYRLLAHQAQRATRLGYTMPTEFDEARACLALRLTSVWGIHTNAERVEALARKTYARMGELTATLGDAGLMRLKHKRDATNDLFGDAPTPRMVKSTKAIRAVIETSWPEALGSIPLTDTGKISTAVEVTEQCANPALAALAEFNSLEKSGSTYVEKLFAGIEAPIHATFDAIGAQSDRTSCSKPNLQNQPRLPGVRECFEPRPGRVFLACDFDSQEMRTLAQTCLDIVGRSKLAQKYQADPDFDPHQDFADSTGGKRQHAKIGNFGIPGGMGVKGLIRYAKGYGQTWSADFADSIRTDYLAQWPEMPDYFRHVRSVVGEANYGRVIIPRSGFRREGCGYTDASNGYWSTLAAHASKAALFEVARRCYSVRTSKLYGCRPVNFVHDEIILEAFDGGDFGHDASAEMRAAMVDAMARYTPDVPPSASATLMRCWSHDAKPVWRDGRLVPWGPA